MIDKVKVGKKYRLISEEGYLRHNPDYNTHLVEGGYFDSDLCVVVDEVDEDDWGKSLGAYIISPEEYQYFEQVEENTESEEPKVITPETTTEVTFTISYGELVRAYYVMGKVNGTTYGKPLWSIIGNLLGDSDYSIYMENNPDYLPINYIPVQQKWESLFFNSKEQQAKEMAIKEKRALIAKLEKEIEELKSDL